MEDSRDVFENRTLKRLLLFIYLVPVFGVIPAIWTLNQRESDRKQREVSRVAILVGLAWLVGTLCLTSGVALSNAENAQGMGISLLLFNSVLTSGYFLNNLWLMVRVWRRQSLDLPGLKRVTKYLP
ncbi:hypothetical protein [Acaryochloris sp. IP29b_bin.148]|uniref:hypothetical protein n=1 Tax=Acaryochloris sp. IP29b_bin.148 TaxID=2969218 RepID=UPI00262441CE|nr:hypothetical protein [Acaryochloris sp. IP29b_bin.148]